MSEPSQARPRRGAHRPRSRLPAVLPSLLAVGAVVALIAGVISWRGADVTEQTRTITAAQTPAAANATPTDAPTPTDTPLPVERDMEVVVLNATGVAGAAQRTADDLAELGWAGGWVGNFRGNVPTTTVYHPSGGEEQAELLASDLPGEVRVRPRFGNLSQERLTLVITETFGGL